MSKNLLNSLIVVCCLLIVGISSAFALKGIDETYAATKYLAYFYDNGGKWLISNSGSDYKVIRYNDAFYLNSDDLKIHRDGCDFGGWAVGSVNGNKFSKPYIDESDNYTEYYAIWTNCVQKYTVTFNLNGAGGSINSQSIASGSKVSNPGNPTRDGYTFLYWSKSSSGSKYDFNTNVTGSFTLYAIWEKNTTVTPAPEPTPQPQPQPQPKPNPNPLPPSVTKYTVSFDLNGGTGEISSQSIEKGGKVSKPKDPTIKNGTFVGWSNDKECKDEYDFDSTVNSDITLYACYSGIYIITFNRQGLPFINEYSFEVNKGTNLNEYKDTNTIIIADATTYSSNDKSCSSVLGKFYGNLDSSKINEKCTDLNKLLNCSISDNCYAGKYVLLDGFEMDEVVYLKNNDSINLEYSTYKSNGLFNDKECKNEYSYSSSINKDLELYECFDLIEEDIDEPVQKPKKKGISATLILIIIAFLAVIIFVGYLFFKSKIANRVD